MLLVVGTAEMLGGKQRIEACRRIPGKKVEVRLRQCYKNSGAEYVSVLYPSFMAAESALIIHAVAKEADVASSAPPCTGC